MRGFSRALMAALLLVAGASAQQPGRGGAARPVPPRPSAPAQPAAPRREVGVPFHVGETLTYDVAWSQYLVAGSAVSRVVEKRPSYNSTAYYIVAEGRPLPLISRIYQLYYKMDSLIDSYTALSQRTSLYTEEGASKRYAVTTFNRPAKKAQFEVQTDTNVKTEFVVPQNVQDGLATLYALRAHDFKPGEHMSIPVADDGSMYTVSFDVDGPVPMKLRVGNMDAWNLRLSIVNASNQPVGNNIAAWISTDSRRLPLRLQADLPVGNFVLVLRTVE